MTSDEKVRNYLVRLILKTEIGDEIHKDGFEQGRMRRAEDWRQETKRARRILGNLMKPVIRHEGAVRAEIEQAYDILNAALTEAPSHETCDSIGPGGKVCQDTKGHSGMCWAQWGVGDYKPGKMACELGITPHMMDEEGVCVGCGKDLREQKGGDADAASSGQNVTEAGEGVGTPGGATQSPPEKAEPSLAGTLQKMIDVVESERAFACKQADLLLQAEGPHGALAMERAKTAARIKAALESVAAESIRDQTPPGPLTLAIEVVRLHGSLHPDDPELHEAICRMRNYLVAKEKT